MRRLISRSFLLFCCCIATASAFAVERPKLSLDGKWEFRFAGDDRGINEHWESATTPFDRQLVVPGCWDEQGIGSETEKMRHNSVGVGWYRRTFSIPADWRGRRIWLSIGGVHRIAVVYVNG